MHLVKDTDLTDISLEISRLEELVGLKILTLWRLGQYSGHAPGGYRFRDDIIVGLSLTLIVFVIIMALVPLLWPLQP